MKRQIYFYFLLSGLMLAASFSGCSSDTVTEESVDGETAVFVDQLIDRMKSTETGVFL